MVTIDRDAFFDHAVDVPPEFAPREGIDARSGLVEKQHGRLVHHGAGQRQTLFEAQRQFAGIVLEVRRQLEGLDHRARGVVTSLPRQSVHAGEEFQVLATLRSA